MKKVYSLLMLSLCAVALVAQCMTTEISLKNRIESADYIIEGEVIAQQSFWDDKNENIYTSNLVHLYKIFDGKIVGHQELELITRGGIVDEEMQIDHPSLQLSKGDIGIFLLSYNNVNNNSIAESSKLYCVPTMVNQSFLAYDFHLGKAFDPFHSYDNVSTDLYGFIEQQTKKDYIVVDDSSMKEQNLIKEANEKISTPYLAYGSKPDRFFKRCFTSPSAIQVEM